MTLHLPVLLTAFGATTAAQWLDYPAPGIPRLPDGRPNLAAPTPRTADGKPELDGIWFVDEKPLDEFGIRSAGSSLEIKPEDIVLTPEGKALQQRMKNDFPGAQCLPVNIAGLAGAQPFKIFSSRGAVVILYEVLTLYRQIFVDGRPLPKDPNPTWLGYSVGKWDGDTLVVETSGFNDRVPVPGGRPHSDALHMRERFRRLDFGHLEIQYTIDDPKVYAKPWTIKQSLHLTPDTELLEYVCNENEKDLRHMVGSNK